jgi:LmbE family N-acetylglucosaminyl deacetylase
MARQQQSTRRQILAGLATGTVSLGLPLVEAAEAPARKLKVVVAGAHPDDPELSAGGTIARYTDLGHEVVCLYLTRGEVGKLKEPKTPKETGEIRSAECEKACAILKSRARFVGQVDASTEVNPARFDAFLRIIEEEKPEIVYTHWPVDPHRDHRTMSLLVYDAWQKAAKKFELFYFEVKSGVHTQTFRPTHYVDITTTEKRKKEACYVHSHGEGVYTSHTDVMNRFRGLECRCAFAEAFVHLPRGAGEALP